MSQHDPFTKINLGRGRHLHVGCGPHLLPSPWENFDREVDITRPLPFRDLSASHILAEHVIEHVDFRAGMRFLRECRRVLEPTGVLRLSFPDLTRFDLFAETEYGESAIKLYLEFMANVGVACDTRADLARFILDGSGHLSCWTLDSAQACLLAAGFAHVVPCEYSHSEHPMLDGIDGHHLDSSLTAATLETTILEARK